MHTSRTGRFAASICVLACSCSEPASLPWAGRTIPVNVALREDLPPLETVSGPYSAEKLREAYEFVADHPDIVKHVPCFCGCGSLGHSAIQDCFVKERSRDDKVVQWSTHGMRCKMCMDIALDAKTRVAEGQVLATIVNEIDAQYEELARLRTATQ